MKKIYIVTGANGFLGNNVIRKIFEKSEGQDFEVRALTHSGSVKANSLEGLDVKAFQGDVADINSLNEIFSVPKTSKVYVIHTAAIVSIKAKKDPKLYDVNVNGTKNVAEKCLEIGAKLVYVNSVHALTEKPKGEEIKEISVFEPNKVKGAYAKSKAEAANIVLDMVKEKGLNACILHPSGIIGPGDFGMTHLTKLIQDLANGDFRVTVNGGYDFVDVRDLSETIVNACELGKKGECYLLSNKYCSIKALANITCEFVGLKKIKINIPTWVCKMFAPICELYYNLKKVPPLFTSYSLYTINSNGNFCNSKAKAELGFAPRSVKKTIEDTILWLKEQNRVRDRFDKKYLALSLSKKEKKLQV